MAVLNPPHVRSSPIADAVARASVVPLTVEQYERMIEQGILAEDASVELLRGVLVRKDRGVIGEGPMVHGALHVLVVSLLTDLAARVRTDRWHMKFQLPVRCPPDGAPEPDGYIVRGGPRDYADRVPSADDVTCVIEAAHSSLDRDREDKLPIYAAAGIGQYVLINLQNSTIEVYEEPDRAGEQYRSHHTVERGGTIELRLPEGSFAVAARDLLP
jgi:Uma2 family endonuclease